VNTARPAHQLLIACATWDPSAAELGAIAGRADAAVDWAAWMDSVRWHRLVPHAHRALAAARAQVPPEISAALASEAIAIGAGALARARQLTQLIALLRDAGVGALPFKGPALSLAAYGDLGVRDSTDLDVVVMRGDVDRARDALIGAGYVSRSGMSRAQERVLQAGYGHLVYTAPSDGAMVELHSRFAALRYPWAIPVKQVFARAAPVEIAGASTLSPDPADQLLLQVMHGARHQWERLEWLVAFAQLLRRARKDEQALIERAEANGSTRALRLALRLARDLLGVRLSPSLAVLADDTRAAVCAARIVHVIEEGKFSTDQPYGFNMAMMDRASHRVRYVALSVLMPTPREWELVRLPDWLVVLYFPVRIVRVLALQPVRLVRALARRLRR
jgi:hypothetical protein